MDPDAGLRIACFAELGRLRERSGGEIPVRGGLDAGFTYDGRRVPFLNPQKGIHRAAVQRGSAALSIMTSFNDPYADAGSDAGLLYAYRRGDVDQADNRALRAAYHERVPLAYFFAVARGWYVAEFPCYVIDDDLAGRRVVVTVGAIRDDEPALPADELERRYAVRETRVRLHQGRFRALVLPAYAERCAICTLHERRLLDAAHITPDPELGGDATVRNGLSLCTIHHRAYDEDLVGVSPDYRVHVARRLLDDDDGPMLELLKRSHGASLFVPRAPAKRPDRERLDARFHRFLAA